MRLHWIPAILAMCGGFLLAVLWFDLMFDVQVLSQNTGDLPEGVLVSIASYYRRVTTDAYPMGRFIGLIMIVTIGCTLVQLRLRELPTVVRGLAIATTAVPILLAAARTFPNAVRLGSRVDSIAVQSDVARAILRDHIGCFASIFLFCSLQVYVALHDHFAKHPDP